MKIDIMTLFPKMIDDYMDQSIMKRAKDAGFVEVNAFDIRAFSQDKHKRVDDAPYGGGNGMVMTCQPLFDCHRSLTERKEVHTVYMSPKGRRFDQKKSIELLEKRHIVLVCGHYEGVDQRFIDECVDEEISIGDFVITGGELAALCVTDAICRMVDGVLSNSECFRDESHFSGLLEYPQYTRPEEFRGLKVPEVLTSGHHANIEYYRRKQSIKKTYESRRDMYDKLELTSKDDIKIIKELKQHHTEKG